MPHWLNTIRRLSCPLKHRLKTLLLSGASSDAPLIDRCRARVHHAPGKTKASRAPILQWNCRSSRVLRIIPKMKALPSGCHGLSQVNARVMGYTGTPRDLYIKGFITDVKAGEPGRAHKRSRITLSLTPNLSNIGHHVAHLCVGQPAFRCMHPATHLPEFDAAQHLLVKLQLERR